MQRYEGWYVVGACLAAAAIIGGDQAWRSPLVALVATACGLASCGCALRAFQLLLVRWRS